MIEFTTHDDVSTVRLFGRFDFRCVKEFQAGLNQPNTRWVVEMEEVDYVDSAALGMLLLLRDHTGDGRRVTIRNARGQPREVLLMAKFDRMFILEP